MTNQCINCKWYDGLNEYLGVCAMIGEVVGVNAGCMSWQDNSESASEDVDNK